MNHPLSARNVFWSFLVGVLLVQAAWILTVPAFRGIDEFDHVFKGAAVARGQWTDHGGAQDGRGGYVYIPEDIVRAAAPVCEWYEYTGPDNCRPSATLPDGRVQIASSATTYNPTYYLLLGATGLPFDGGGVDYAMRIVGAVMSALMIAWAAALIGRWSRTQFPLLIFAIGLTPVFLYSTAIASPNGLTYSGAALLWSALIAAPRSESSGRSSAAAAAVGAVTLVTTHTTGAMWLLFITILAAMLVPLRTSIATVRKNRGAWLASAGFVALATVFAGLWTIGAKANALGPELAKIESLEFNDMASFEVLWIFQAIATFPTLNEPAPGVVYAIWLALLIPVLIAALRGASGRPRWAVLGVLALVVLVPAALTAYSYPRLGLAWQGRYTLPLWIGFIILAGVVLDKPQVRRRFNLVPICFVLMATATAVSAVNVGTHEVSYGPTSPVAANFPGGFILVGLLAATGALVPAVAVNAKRRRAQTTTEPATGVPG